MSKVTNDEIAILLYRLFWLVTQTPGVARYATDVRHFTDIAIKAGIQNPEIAEKTAKSYEDKI